MKKFELLKTIDNIENFVLQVREELKSSIETYTEEDCDMLEEYLDVMLQNVEDGTEEILGLIHDHKELNRGVISNEKMD